MGEKGWRRSDQTTAYATICRTILEWTCLRLLDRLRLLTQEEHCREREPAEQYQTKTSVG